MKNVSLMCILILQGEDKGSVLLMSVKNIVKHYFNKLKRSDVIPTNQPETTHTISTYSLICSIDNTYNLQSPGSVIKFACEAMSYS